jgi:branched-chain amino acid aminotransferase
MVRHGRLVTPPATSGALEGITLDTIVELARLELDLDVAEREIDRTELYVADEVFLCGTLAEIQPVVSIDGLPVGSGVPGHLTRDLQFLYEQAVQGESGRDDWTTAVYGAGERAGVAAG